MIRTTFLKLFDNRTKSFAAAVMVFTVMWFLNLISIYIYFFGDSISSNLALNFCIVTDAGFFMGVLGSYGLFKSYNFVSYKNYTMIKEKIIGEDEGRKVTGKRDLQHQLILAVTNAFGYDPLKIPTGGKSAIREVCLKRVKIFTESAFDHAWKDGTSLGLFRLEESDKFSSKQ